MNENKNTSLLFDFVSVLMTGVIIIAVIFTFFFRTASVIGKSMEPTLYENDMLMVTARKSDYKAGDIVIITQPNSFNEPIVKRIIALGGQTVDIDFDKGIVYVDGKEEQGDYTLADKTYDRENFTEPVTVPEGYVFVMGDNRNNSTDSRSMAVGLIDERYIYGSVIGRMVPFGSWKVV